MRRLALCCTLLACMACHAVDMPADAAQQWFSSAFAPRYAALAVRADALKTASASYCNAPDSASLARARQAWRDTLLAWNALDVVPPEPVVQNRLNRRIDFQPTRPADIEAALQATADTELHSRNAATRGLPALEYLWWNPQSAATAERCRYALAVANSIALEVGEIAPVMARYQNELAESNALQQALLVQSLNALIDHVGNWDRRLPAEAKRDNFRYWRSNTGRSSLLAELDGIDRYWHGGLAAWLQQSGLETRAVDKAINHARASVQALPEQYWQPAARAQRVRVISAGKALGLAMADQVATPLDIMLGFGESDGD